jgi:hypothetical protein
MHLNAILFLPLFLFGPGPLPPFLFPSLFFLVAAQPNLVFPSPSFLPHGLAQLACAGQPAAAPFLPARSSSPAPSFSHSLTLTGGARPSGSSPTSSTSPARTRIRVRPHLGLPPPRRASGPHAKARGRPIKSRPCPRISQNLSRGLLALETLAAAAFTAFWMRRPRAAPPLLHRPRPP